MADSSTQTPHLRRLCADYEAMRDLVDASPFLRMIVLGEPPERYRVFFNCKGVMRDPDSGRLKPTQRHMADVYLHADYPHFAPDVVWRTPIFHPNMRFANGAGTVCVSGWTPRQSLGDFVHHVARMIQYKEYDTTLALDWGAARWAKEHPELLPVDQRPVIPDGAPAASIAQVEASP